MRPRDLALERRSTMTDRALRELLPTLDRRAQIETVLAKFVHGTLDRAHNGEYTATQAAALIGQALTTKLRQFLPELFPAASSAPPVADDDMPY